MSGLRRAEAPTRANAPIVARDLRGLVKVNPIATWTDPDVAGYIADHDVPVNPLLDQGYPVDRVLAVHPAGGSRRRSPFGPLGRPGQDGVRPAPVGVPPLTRVAHGRRWPPPTAQLRSPAGGPAPTRPCSKDE